MMYFFMAHMSFFETVRFNDDLANDYIRGTFSRRVEARRPQADAEDNNQ